MKAHTSIHSGRSCSALLARAFEAVAPKIDDAGADLAYARAVWCGGRTWPKNLRSRAFSAQEGAATIAHSSITGLWWLILLSPA
jgi:hypothetical protein